MHNFTAKYGLFDFCKVKMSIDEPNSGTDMIENQDGGEEDSQK